MAPLRPRRAGSGGRWKRGSLIRPTRSIGACPGRRRTTGRARPPLASPSARHPQRRRCGRSGSDQSHGVARSDLKGIRMTNGHSRFSSRSATRSVDDDLNLCAVGGKPSDQCAPRREHQAAEGRYHDSHASADVRLRRWDCSRVDQIQPQSSSAGSMGKTSRFSLAPSRKVDRERNSADDCGELLVTRWGRRAWSWCGPAISASVIVHPLNASDRARSAICNASGEGRRAPSPHIPATPSREAAPGVASRRTNSDSLRSGRSSAARRRARRGGR